MLLRFVGSVDGGLILNVKGVHNLEGRVGEIRLSGKQLIKQGANEPIVGCGAYNNERTGFGCWVLEPPNTFDIDLKVWACLMLAE